MQNIDVLENFIGDFCPIKNSMKKIKHSSY